nr:disease resistance protein RGA2-like [Lolium perenne]XP_051184726.1 disease resistance protein RGA2-like [Lolium perenne]XP_051184727.1 disease resistance protein RGA2-like [Lolium perenne]
MAVSMIQEHAIELIMDAGVNAVEAIQLNNHISDLRTSLPRARLLIDRAEWGRLKSSDLATLLSKLKDTTYDAEDLLRAFDDQLARQKIEDEGRGRAGRIFSSSLNLFKVWIRGSRGRLTEAQGNLSKVMDEVERVVALMGLDVPGAQQLMPETSPVLTGPVFGRDEERDVAIEKLGVTIGREEVRDWAIQQMGVPLVAGARGGESALGNERAAQGSAKRLKGESSRGAELTATSNLSVLPIVGIGGVGKTTLAQYIFNDARVEEHFSLMLWVCVSDIFDNKRITKEILESIPRDGNQPFNSLGSLGALQKELKKRLQGQKFLLVLDDVWEITKMKWQNLCAPLWHGHDGSMVLVTTRFQKVVDLVGTFKSIIPLEGLPTTVFREFFSKCAFGEEHPGSFPQLQDIGHKIADRLCGSPLAAKTLGRLLNMDLTVEKWRTILNSELWQLKHQENEILPALQLTYLYLPYYLKRCFAVCSMFPKDYSFERDELARFWVAQGLVKPKENMRLEDVGRAYLDDLRSRFLFLNDPKSPEQDKCVMHDLIHDMAQSVSVDECFLMQRSSCQNRRGMPPPHTVRCMSVEVDNEARMGGFDHLNKKFREFHLNKLNSLRFGMGLKVEDSWFNQLPNILFLSLKGCKLEMLPESICELNSLRYLDISNTAIKELPDKLWSLYTLQFLMPDVQV